MPVQLRIYTVNKGALAQFTQEWDREIRPVREKLGFRVLGAWTCETTNQFIWLMGYDGPESWEARDKAYFNSPERKAMQPDPARHIARMEQYFVESALGPGPQR
jgi:NIPSNAP protein